MKKYLAEFVGTFTLVLFGCGTAVVAGDEVGTAGIAFAFGFALIAMAYGIGPISGCHINPAVSLGAFIAKRLDGKDLVGYIVGQILGAIAGAGILLLIMSGIDGGYDAGVGGLGQNGWGGDYSDYGLSAALVFELVATFLFVVVILGATQAGAPVQIAGLAIGIALVVIHLLGIPITGTSVNPARSLGPAIFVGGKALSQLWLFLVIPSAAGILSGVLFRRRVLEK